MTMLVARKEGDFGGRVGYLVVFLFGQWNINIVSVMLALPASAGQYGFLPTLLIMAIACVFMTIGGLYMAEACLASRHQDPHLISLSDEYLGPQAKALSWITYLLIGITSFLQDLGARNVSECKTSTPMNYSDLIRD